MRLGILNPLPGVLGHFNRAVVDNLEMVEGLTVVQLTVTGTEMESGSNDVARVRSALRFIREARREITRAELDCVINLWPTFGYVEPLLWRTMPTRTRVWTILHDVDPLRAQFGYWPRAIAPLRLGACGAHGWLVHTEYAADAATELGFERPVVVPHPILPEEVRRRPKATEVLVFGQYKPARDTDLLVRLGPALRAAGFVPHIVGRGWPKLEGWECDDRFVDEADVAKLLGDAAAVVIPYRRYFQSGVALRAIESGTPVVGIRTEFLESYLGVNWPGLVEPGVDTTCAWVDAIRRAICVPTGEVTALAEGSRSEVVRGWQRALAKEICEPDEGV